MEERIREIINSLDNFKIVDFSQEDVNLPASDSYYVQLIQNNRSVENDTREFDLQANILVSFDIERIDVYVRINVNISEDDIKNLLKALDSSFPETMVTHTLWKD